MRLLVECTYVYEHPRDNSGIQRVVRNIVSQLAATREIADAIPVVLKQHRIYRVEKLRPENHLMYLFNLMHSKLVRIRERGLLFYQRLDGRRPFSNHHNIRRGLYVLYKTADGLLYVLMSAVFRLCRLGEVDRRICELSVRPDDVLVLLDSSWHSDCFHQVERLKSQGLTIVSVIYDLIPLTHSRFCDEGLVDVFRHWFQWISRTADGFVAISKTIRDQTEDYVRQSRIAPEAPNGQWFDYFHLGSELDLAKANGLVRQKVQKPFRNNVPVYLMVGTIEPRKNHSYLLDAFEKLWLAGLEIHLCFVGKVGWKCQALMDRVEGHEEYNRRLFMLTDLTDTELELCYRKARSLVFPAFVEGFGLPLVEAMQRGLPAMASDIPVFREVGGDYIAYFDLEEPDTLADLIHRYEATGVFPAARTLEGWSWLNWKDSARQLMTKIVSNVSMPRIETGN